MNCLLQNNHAAEMNRKESGVLDYRPSIFLFRIIALRIEHAFLIDNLEQCSVLTAAILEAV